MPGTAVVADPRMLAHDPGRGHPERPDRLRVLLEYVAEARGLTRLGTRPASEDELALVHPPEHLRRWPRRSSAATIWPSSPPRWSTTICLE